MILKISPFAEHPWNDLLTGKRAPTGIDIMRRVVSICKEEVEAFVAYAALVTKDERLFPDFAEQYVREVVWPLFEATFPGNHAMQAALRDPCAHFKTRDPDLLRAQAAKYVRSHLEGELPPGLARALIAQMEFCLGDYHMASIQAGFVACERACPDFPKHMEAKTFEARSTLLCVERGKANLIASILLRRREAPTASASNGCFFLRFAEPFFVLYSNRFLFFALSMKSTERESRFTLTVLLFLTAMVLFLSSFVLVQSKQTQLQLQEIRKTLQQK